ncbi:MAG: ankyrin repeat domain-containing protein [Spirochaetales bacterium]|nr:ankyrin repeat domain-containing protein [Spirochaetales bacterium]
MRIGIFFPEQSKEEGESLISELRTALSVKPHGYLMRPDWHSTDGGELEHNLSHFDLLVVLSSGGLKFSESESWIVFVLGYLMGRDLPGCFFETIPQTSGGIGTKIPHFSTLSELREFIQFERNLWIHDQRISQARQRLMDRGLGLTEENLAREVSKGHKEAVEDFLTIGFSVDSVDPQGTPILVLSTRAGFDEIVKILLEYGANVNLPSTDRGNTVLMEAALRGNTELIKIFLSRGAEINTQSKNGQTALMMAIGEGQLLSALSLIYSKADLTLTDQLGMTARKYAALFSHTQVVEAIDRILPLT